MWLSGSSCVASSGTPVTSSWMTLASVVRKWATFTSKGRLVWRFISVSLINKTTITIKLKLLQLARWTRTQQTEDRRPLPLAWRRGEFQLQVPVPFPVFTSRATLCCGQEGMNNGADTSANQCWYEKLFRFTTINPNQAASEGKKQTGRNNVHFPEINENY